MPKRFRLIPVDVEAIKITDEDSVTRAIVWSGGVPSEEDGGFTIYVPTVNSILRVSKGDYLVRHGRGDFYVMSEEDFEKKYSII